MDAYKLVVSKNAEKIPIDLISNEFRNALFSEISFSPETHDIYKIPIGIEFISKNSNRKRKKFSIEKTDRFFIEIKLPDNNIHLAGIYPTTTLISGQTSIDFEGDVLFELNLKLLKFKITGKFKNIFKRNKIEIYASRIPPIAQWIYTKDFILSGKNFNNHIICSVPKNMDVNRYIICNVESKEKNRTINKLTNKKVVLDS